MTTTATQSSDAALLRDYIATRSESAFTELTRRHLPWVRSAALRQVRDPHTADDVAQAVFIALARQAHTLDPDRPLAAWLFQVTRYASANVVRTAARRARREHEAATMLPTHTPDDVSPSQWDELADHLDPFVARLGRTDRQAILLRYYQQHDFPTIAAALGTTEAAARKRTTRAVEKLRDMFARRGLTIAPAAFIPALEHYTTTPAPVHRAAEIASAALTTATATTAAPLADAALRLMSLAKAKAIATVTAVALAGATAATAIIAATRPAPTAPPSPQAPAVNAIQPTSNPDEDESRVPGDVQLARWDVILTADAADALTQITRPVPTASKSYWALTGKGADLRRAIRTAAATGDLLRATRELTVGQEQPPGSGTLYLPMALWFNHNNQSPTDRIMMAGGDSTQPVIERRPGDRLHLALNHTNLSVNFGERTTQWAWTGFSAPKAIVYDGDLPAGDAIAFLAQYTPPSGTPYFHLVVFETFKCGPSQLRYVATQHDAAWWCTHGPSRLRAWADAARTWSASAAHDAQDVPTPRFEKKLSDGKTIRLTALTRPSRWPFCWWDAAGQAVRSNLQVGLEGDPTPSLIAAVDVRGPLDEFRWASPRGTGFVPPSGEYQTSTTTPLADGATSFDVGILVGPWKDVGHLKLGQSLVVDGITYRIDRPNAFSSDAFLVHFHRSAHTDDQLVVLTAVARAGKETDTFSSFIVFGRGPSAGASLEDQPNFHGFPLAEVDHFRLYRRRRQWVTFDGFAPLPAQSPPTVVTPVDATAAEADRARRAAEARAESLRAKRQEWAAIAPDPTTHRGAVRRLLDAVHTGDPTAVRALLTATDPAVTSHVDAVARLLVRTDALHRKVAARFGETTDPDARPVPGLTDLEATLLSGTWEPNPDGSLELAGLTARKTPAGQYQFDLDALARHGSVAAGVAQWTAALDRVEQVLADPSVRSPEDFGSRMKAPPATKP